MRLPLLLVVLGSACATEEVRNGVVAPLRAPCQGGAGALMCTRLHDTAEDKSHLLFGELSGYAHRWGVEAHVRYHVESVPEPLEDGPSQYYVVDEVVTEIEDAVGPELDLAFPQSPPGNGWFTAGDGAGQLRMIDTDIVCDPAICDEILTRTEDLLVGFSVRFAIVGPQTLRALRVQ